MFRSLLLISGLLVLLVSAALLFPEQILCVESGSVQADALVLLGGGRGERPGRAAELFHSGAAPTLIISGNGDAEQNKRALASNGVPSAAVELESKSGSTKENAQFSIPLLRALGAKRVIIATSWYHSRRALHVFQRYAPDVQFYSCPSYDG